MCIIIVANKNKKIPNEHIKLANELNCDGFGISASVNDKLFVYKSISINSDDIINLYNSIRQVATGDIVLHFRLATHGDIHTMVLTPLGLMWGLLSAFALACYTLIPGDLPDRFGAVSVTGYGMIIGGVSMFIGTRAWNAPMIHDPKCIAAFVAMVIIGTVLTFTLYLLGIKLIGPVKTSMLASVEPVSATVIMVVWLKESFQFLDFVGFMCIFVTVFLLTKKEEAAE